MTEQMGRYELVRGIGAGGMAEVWLARVLEQTGWRWCVVKRMLAHLRGRVEFTRMFVDEARVASRLNHPNVLKVYDVGEDNGVPFMALEYVEGVHLGALMAHLLDQDKVIPLQHVAFMVSQACRGLHYAHEATDENGDPLGIVHRDVSPQNIMVSRQGEVKLLDFGIAKTALQSSVTKTGVLKGKLGYMAPEHCSGSPVDRRADVYSMGVTLHELLTGVRLFPETNPLQVVRRITQDDVEAPSSVNPAVPAALDEMVLAATARSVRVRYQDAKTLADRLDGWLFKRKDRPSQESLAVWLQQNASGILPERLPQLPPGDPRAGALPAMALPPVVVATGLFPSLRSPSTGAFPRSTTLMTDPAATSLEDSGARPVVMGQVLRDAPSNNLATVVIPALQVAPQPQPPAAAAPAPPPPPPAPPPPAAPPPGRAADLNTQEMFLRGLPTVPETSALGYGANAGLGLQTLSASSAPQAAAPSTALASAVDVPFTPPPPPPPPVDGAPLVSTALAKATGFASPLNQMFADTFARVEGAPPPPGSPSPTAPTRPAHKPKAWRRHGTNPFLKKTEADDRTRTQRFYERIFASISTGIQGGQQMYVSHGPTMEDLRLPGAPPNDGQWVPFVHVPHLEPVLQLVAQLGGKVVQGSTAVPAGAFAIIQDPSGGTLGLFAAGP